VTVTFFLPTPAWTNLNQIGMKSAVENIADGYISLEFADANPVFPATSIYYLIYAASSVADLFLAPKMIATSSSVSVPPHLLSLNNYVAVQVAQLGIASNINLSMTQVSDNLYIYPASTVLVEPLTELSEYVSAEGSAGFPTEDGYLKIGNDIILYSSIEDSIDGYQNFIISDRDPFGSGEVNSYAIGTEVGLFKGANETNELRFKVAGSCGLSTPVWEDKFVSGVRLVEDLGIGTSIRLKWYDAKVPLGFSRVYYNIYQSTSLQTLFASRPRGFSIGSEAIVPYLTPGKSYYYGVRAFYQLSNLQVNEFNQLGSGFYAYPDATKISGVDGHFYPGQLGALPVLTTEGFPSQGYLKIGSEILQYSSITETSFNVSHRDLFSFGFVSDYANETLVVFFKGIEDGNSKFYRTTPSWDGAVNIPQMPLPDGYNGIPSDGYNGAAYNQDSDGYRNVLEDIITEDHSAFEAANEDFEQFPYCGFRTPNFVKLHSSEQCGTYQGGRRMQIIPGVNGGRPVPIAGGLNIFEAAQQRSEVILGLTGECFSLLTRKTTGKKCPRLSIRSEHPHARCGTCFGTTFLGGYDRFVNQRELRPGEINPNGFISMRVSPYANDLELTADRGLAQIDTVEAWTIAVPIIKDRDILIRYVYDEQLSVYKEDYRYEVLNVTRSKLFFGKDGKQQVSMRKIDKTRDIYKYKVTLV